MVTLGSDFGYALLASAGISMQVIVMGFVYAGAGRKKHGVAYPDMGSGRHASKLSLKDWEDFNNHQRVHGNYVEGIASSLALLLGASVKSPILASQFAVAYMLGRQLYGFGYVRGGVKHPLRVAGVVLVDVSLIAWFLLSIRSGLSLIGWL